MFGKLLIANRGEIACRVMRTAHRLGIRTGRGLLGCGPGRAARRHGRRGVAARPCARVSQSYLDIERMLAAAAASGADAVHPGYGFLSESPAFVDACTTAGIVFIGPPAGAVRAMGLKDAAKRVMEDAGVPVVPGYHGEEQDDAVLLAHARRIGFPVLVKAVAGGGGKGMRRADDEAGFEPALEAARREAHSNFGDDRVLIERCIERPRHVEVQVFADAHGNAAHLFERDCSLQRRHQKVIEEAPAPGMTPEMREAMGAAAVAAARAIDYRGAGTVEFIADASEGLREDRFWFMEMNTRLQVEHPVTEMVTGTDLVEWQIRVAAGEPLPVGQADLSMAGHAVEARVYAEDPQRGFLPATGTLAHLATPPESGHVRIDSGVREGDAITSWYDPMIAKVIAHGEDRGMALDRLAGALREFEVAGLATNVPFLSRLVAAPGFRAGDVDTGFIDRELDALVARDPIPEPVLAAAAMHAAGALAEPPDGSAWKDPWSTLTGWRPWGGAEQRVHLEIDGETIEVLVTFLEDGGYRFDTAGTSLVAKVVHRDGARLVLDLSDRIAPIRVVSVGDGLHMLHDGRTYTVAPPDQAVEDGGDGSAPARVTAPLPGKIVKVAVRSGETVGRGATLVVLEAMKMELSVDAPREGVIDEVTVSEGDQVVEGAVLVTFANTQESGQIKPQC